MSWAITELDIELEQVDVLAKFGGKLQFPQVLKDVLLIEWFHKNDVEFSTISCPEPKVSIPQRISFLFESPVVSVNHIIPGYHHLLIET